jgi:Leucine-rich repeat (LRR) protein
MTLDEIVAQIDEAAEKELTELDLSGLWLEELPPEIGKCTHLTDLKLSGNQITCIPESIGQLSNLRVLYLTGTKITEIPESLEQLFNLEVLYLLDNLNYRYPRVTRTIVQPDNVGPSEQ